MKNGLIVALMFLSGELAAAQSALLAAPQSTAKTALPTGQGQTSAKIEETQSAPTKKWSVRVGLQTASNLLEADSYSRSLDNTYSLTPSLLIGEQLTVALNANYVQNLRQEDESDFTNTKIKASLKPIELVTDTWSLGPAVSGVVPTNQEVVKTTSFQGAVSLEPTTSVSLKRIHLPVSLTYGLGLTRNFHEFDRRNDGSQNTQYVIVNRGLIEGEISEKISIGLTGKFTSGLTYSSSWRSKFELTEEIAYQATPAMAIAIGHTNEANTLKSDMQSSNIELFNENTSAVYGGLEVVY